MQQYNKTRDIKGIVGIYNDALRFRDMITNSAQERVRILVFWKKYGDIATKEWKRGQEPFLGLPGFRRVDFKLNLSIILSIQFSSPYGFPLLTQRRKDSSSPLV